MHLATRLKTILLTVLKSRLLGCLKVEFQIRTIFRLTSSLLRKISRSVCPRTGPRTLNRIKKQVLWLMSIFFFNLATHPSPQLTRKRHTWPRHSQRHPRFQWPRWRRQRCSERGPGHPRAGKTHGPCPFLGQPAHKQSQHLIFSFHTNSPAVCETAHHQQVICRSHKSKNRTLQGGPLFQSLRYQHHDRQPQKLILLTTEGFISYPSCEWKL